MTIQSHTSKGLTCKAPKQVPNTRQGLEQWQVLSPCLYQCMLCIMIIIKGSLCFIGRGSVKLCQTLPFSVCMVTMVTSAISLPQPPVLPSLPNSEFPTCCAYKPTKPAIAASKMRKINERFLSIYVPGTVLGARDSEMNEGQFPLLGYSH